MTRAIASGNDQNVKARLAELDRDILDAGVERFTAREVTKLRKAPGTVYAIPPLSLWSRMVRTLREVAEPLREAYGKPLRVLNGYRPSDYNAAVSGSKGSRHLYFEALDLTADDMQRLREVAADFFVENPTLSIGLGLYRGNIHVDIGYRRRFWGSQSGEIEAAHKRADRTQPITIGRVT
jgi:hypothetical protein